MKTRRHKNKLKPQLSAFSLTLSKIDDLQINYFLSNSDLVCIVTVFQVDIKSYINHLHPVDSLCGG